MRPTIKRSAFFAFASVVLAMPTASRAAEPKSLNGSPTTFAEVLPNVLRREWRPHTVRQYHGDTLVDVAGTAQVTTNRVHWSLQLVYLRDRNRLLLRGKCGLYSDDLGDTWREAAIPGGSLTYLGDGHVLVRGRKEIWRSTDYGITWEPFTALPPVPGLKEAYRSLGPLLVDRDSSTGRIVRLAESGYGRVAGLDDVLPADGAQGYVRFSTDGGLTWPTVVKTKPRTSETVLIRAGNGDIVAAARTSGTVHIPNPEAPYDWRRVGNYQDFYGGLAVYISKDNGNTWSALKKLFEFGRHHPSIVRMPNSDLVMSYVVRLGYGDPLKGLPQYGIEAVVSRDHGQTWNLDRRYILDKWDGEWLDRPGGKVKLMAPNETYTVLLPDGTLITAYVKHFLGAERGVQLVRWRPTE